MRYSRRRFLKASALAAAAPAVLASHVLGAGPAAPSNRITMGFIGIGKQGEYHLRGLVKNNEVRILGISEVYKQFRDMAVDLVNSTYGSSRRLGFLPASPRGTTSRRCSSPCPTTGTRCASSRRPVAARTSTARSRCR